MLCIGCDKTDPKEKRNTEVNLTEPSNKEKWTKGRCTEFPDDFKTYETCQLCLLHQYGLHRTKDNTLEICEGKRQNPQKNMQECYWDPFPTLKQGHTQTISLFNDSTIAAKGFCTPSEMSQIPSSLATTVVSDHGNNDWLTVTGHLTTITSNNHNTDASVVTALNAYKFSKEINYVPGRGFTRNPHLISGD